MPVVGDRVAFLPSGAGTSFNPKLGSLSTQVIRALHSSVHRDYLAKLSVPFKGREIRRVYEYARLPRHTY